MNNYPIQNQIVQNTVLIVINKTEYKVNTSSALEINLNELKKLYREIDRKIGKGKNIDDYDDTFFSLIETIEDEVYTNPSLYIKLYYTLCDFAELISKSNFNCFVKEIFDYINNLYESQFKLRDNFWYEKKLYELLKKSNLICSYPNQFRNPIEYHFSDKELDEFLLKNKDNVLRDIKDYAYNKELFEDKLNPCFDERDKRNFEAFKRLERLKSTLPNID